MLNVNGFCALLIASLMMATLAANVSAVQFDGVALEEAIRHSDGTSLVLNGAGVRKKFGLVRVYAAGLYLPAKSTDAAAIIAGRKPSRIALLMLRAVDVDSLLSAFHDALGENLSAQAMTALKSRVDELDAIFRKIPPREKDRLALDIGADGSVQVLHNDQDKGKVLGPDIGPAMLQIWLGAAPVQKDLKAGLLGLP